MGRFYRIPNILTLDIAKKSSRLRIRKASPADEGVYECRAKNILGESLKHSMVTVEAGTTTKTPSHEELCPIQTYCLNGGTCFYLKSLGTNFCKCAEGFTGRRCQMKGFLGPIGANKDGSTRDDQHFDRVMTITGLVITALVILALIITAWFMARRARTKSEKRKELRKNQAEANGNYKSVPQIDRPGALGLAETSFGGTQSPHGAPKVPDKESFTIYTQTERYLLEELLGKMRKGSQAGIPSRISQSSLRRNGTPPRLDQLSPNDPLRNRLLGTSTSPEMAGRHPVAANVTVHNAIGEPPDHEASRHNSPSQSSKTESQHGLEDSLIRRVKIAETYAAPKRASLDGINTSPPGMDLDDVDQHSDYDNQQSDMEVNIESEVEGQGLDDLESQGRGENCVESSEDSSDSSTSSEAGEEHALFAKMRQTSRGSSLKKTPNADHGSGAESAWDQFGNPPPIFASDELMCNPYAIDDDIITNQHMPNSNDKKRKHKHNDDIEDRIAYLKDDQNGTVV